MFSFVFMAVGCTMLCILLSVTYFWIAMSARLGLGAATRQWGQLCDPDRPLRYSWRDRLAWRDRNLLERLHIPSDRDRRHRPLSMVTHHSRHTCPEWFQRAWRTSRPWTYLPKYSQRRCTRAAVPLAPRYAAWTQHERKRPRARHRHLRTGPPSENIALGLSSCSCILRAISSLEPIMSARSIFCFFSFPFAAFTVSRAEGRYWPRGVDVPEAFFEPCSVSVTLDLERTQAYASVRGA
jgi:hypothetical protein